MGVCMFVSSEFCAWESVIEKETVYVCTLVYFVEE